MAKIMLVEDDRNLSAIYSDRLVAEGHEVVSAHDGEEALAMAVKEKPELIISDVMMPKISGFDMLDILRSTPETRNTKVIMMTALSQAQDQQRADQLGADRYLVKSQVTLDDVARVVNETLSDEAAPAVPTSAPITPSIVSQPVTAAPELASVVTPTMASSAPPPTAAPEPAPTPGAPAPEPVTSPNDPAPAVATDDTTVVDDPPAQAAATVPAPATEPAQEDAEPSAEEQADIAAQIDKFVASNVPDSPVHAGSESSVVAGDTTPPDLNKVVAAPAEPSAPAPDQPELTRSKLSDRVIHPVSDPENAKPDIHKLYEEHMANEAAQAATAAPGSNGAVAPTPTPAAEDKSDHMPKPGEPGAISLSA